MQLSTVLSWLLLMVALFVGFIVQGAMWAAAQDQNRNGWVIALTWPLAIAIVIDGIHTVTHIWLAPSC